MPAESSYRVDGPDGPDLPLAALVDVSARVAATSKRSDKVALLAGFLAGLPTTRVRTATSVLSGTLPTPSLGVGPARVRAAWVEATAQTSLEESGPPLTLGELERGLECEGAPRG